MPEVQTVKQLLSKSIPYPGGTKSCVLNQLPMLAVYIPMLEVQPYTGGTDAADPYSIYYVMMYFSTPVTSSNIRY